MLTYFLQTFARERAGAPQGGGGFEHSRDNNLKLNFVIDSVSSIRVHPMLFKHLTVVGIQNYLSAINEGYIVKHERMYLPIVAAQEKLLKK